MRDCEKKKTGSWNTGKVGKGSQRIPLCPFGLALFYINTDAHVESEASE